MGGSKDFPITDHEFVPCNCGDPECHCCAVCKEQEHFHWPPEAGEHEKALLQRIHATQSIDQQWRLPPVSAIIIAACFDALRSGSILLDEREFLSFVAICLAKALDESENREYQRVVHQVPTISTSDELSTLLKRGAK